MKDSFILWQLPTSATERRHRIHLPSNIKNWTDALQHSQSISLKHPQRTYEFHVNNEHITTFICGCVELNKGVVKSCHFPIEHGLIWRTIPQNYKSK